MKTSTANQADLQAYNVFYSQKMAQYKETYPEQNEAQLKNRINKQWTSTHKKPANKGIKTSKAKTAAGLNASALAGTRLNFDTTSPIKKFSLPKKESSLKKTEKKEDQQSDVPEQPPSGMSEKKVEPAIITPKKQSKTKAISKKIRKPAGKKKFFEFYTEKLKGQHHRWSEQQILVIVKLLWNKKQSVSMGLKVFSSKISPIRYTLRAFKAISGRKLFGNIKRREESMPAELIKEKWNTLPQQSKRYWGRRGGNMRGYLQPLRTPRISTRVEPRERFLMSSQPMRPLGFMNKVM